MMNEMRRRMVICAKRERVACVHADVVSHFAVALARVFRNAYMFNIQTVLGVNTGTVIEEGTAAR